MLAGIGRGTQAVVTVVRLAGPVDAFHRDQVILDHINNPESAHAKTAILTLVKSVPRMGV